MKAAEVIKLVAILAAIVGIVFLYLFYRKCENPDKRRIILFSAINLLYFATIYTLALFTDWYIVRSGMLTVSGVIVLIGLLVVNLFVDEGCHE